MKLMVVLLAGWAALLTAAAEQPTWSIARIWNEEILAAIRIDKPNPPVHARNLFHLGVAMYDCWAAYDSRAVGYLHFERLKSFDVDASRRQAISYAAYRILRHRYASSANATMSLAAFDKRLRALGYDPAVLGTEGDTAAALGNRVAADIIAWGMKDGSNEANGYDDLGYVNPQPPMIVLYQDMPQGFGIPWGTDPNRWQPLAFDGLALWQNGIVADQVQKYVGVTWLDALPFALRRSVPHLPWIDPGPPPRLGSSSEGEYKAAAVALIKASAQLDSDEIVDASPGKMGNNPLGTDDGTGREVNPATGKPYAQNPVRLGDYARVMAEFWADGPHSETPPGHWHVIANQVSDDPRTVKRIGGEGPVVDNLEWDVKLYFAMGAAVHDAACAAWSLKRFYEGVRPITMIRLMASLGQSSDAGAPSYHPAGLPLEPGLVELITPDTASPGGRHAGVGTPGEIAVFSWPGEPTNRTAQVSHTRWIRGVDWVPYQRKSFVTPAFPGYISGHSTFSRAAAEIMRSITGSEYFPGGLGTMTAQADAFLAFEHGPTRTTEIQWATYYDAADLAGRSRRWGGIHVSQDDYAGRMVGAQVGGAVWGQVRGYFDGSVLLNAASVQIRRAGTARTLEVSPVVSGWQYTLQRSPDLLHWSEVDSRQAAEQPVSFQDTTEANSAFYRVVCLPGQSVSDRVRR